MGRAAKHTHDRYVHTNTVPPFPFPPTLNPLGSRVFDVVEPLRRSPIPPFVVLPQGLPILERVHRPDRRLAACRMAEIRNDGAGKLASFGNTFMVLHLLV